MSGGIAAGGLGAVLAGALVAVAGAGAGDAAAPSLAGVLLAPSAPGVTVSSSGDGAVRITAPPGTPVLSPIRGAVDSGGGPSITVTGSGGDGGAVLTVTGATPSASGRQVRPGDPVARVGPGGAAVVELRVDGQALDLAGLVDADGVAIAPGDDPRAGGSQGAGGGTQLRGADALLRPVDGAVISQLFGCTSFAAEPPDPACQGGHFHSGVDLAAPLGTPVRAAQGGVAAVVVSAVGYGLHVIVRGGAGGLSTLYGHLASVAVTDGAAVAPGEVIGTVGSTGNSTGPHLHFEVRHRDVPVDPLVEMELP